MAIVAKSPHSAPVTIFTKTLEDLRREEWNTYEDLKGLSEKITKYVLDNRDEILALKDGARAQTAGAIVDTVLFFHGCTTLIYESWLTKQTVSEIRSDPKRREFQFANHYAKNGTTCDLTSSPRRKKIYEGFKEEMKASDWEEKEKDLYETGLVHQNIAALGVFLQNMVGPHKKRNCVIL